MNHLSIEQIDEFVDGALEPRRMEEIDLHLRTCEECRGKLLALRRFDRMLRRLPPQRVSPAFTTRVLSSLGVDESPSLAWTILKNLAPLVALTLVVGIVMLILRLSGSTLGPTPQATQTITGTIGDAVSVGTSTLSRWLRTISPIASGGYGLTVLVLLLFALIAAIDRFIFLPLAKRKIS